MATSAIEILGVAADAAKGAGAISSIGRIVEFGERLEKIAKVFETVDKDFEIVTDLIDEITGWGDADTAKSAELKALEKIESQLAAIQADITLMDDKHALWPLSQAIDKISSQLDIVAKKIASFDRSTGRFVDDATTYYLDWYLSVDQSSPNAGRNIAIAAMVDICGGFPLSRLFCKEPSSDKTLFDLIDTAVADVRGNQASPTVDKALAGRTRYDVYEGLWFKLVHLYRRAHALHDSAAAIAASLLFADTPAASDKIATTAKLIIDNLKTQGDGSGQPWTTASYFTAESFGSRLSLSRADLDWYGKIAGPMLAMEGVWSDDTVYHPVETIASAHQQSPEGQDADYNYYCLAEVTAPADDCFITGLRTRATYTPSTGETQSGWEGMTVHTSDDNSRNDIWLQVHFSRMVPGGRFEAVGWYPETAPACENLPAYILMGAMDLSALNLPHVDDPAATANRIPVMIGAGMTGTGDSHYFAAQARFGWLELQPDGGGKVTPMIGNDGNPVTLMSNDPNGRTHLRVTPENVKNVLPTAVGRLDADGNPDPSAIVTRFLLQRDDGGSTFFVQAEVTSRLRTLKWVQPDSADRFVYAIAPGTRVDSGFVARHLTSGGDWDNARPDTPLYYLVGETDRRLAILGEPTGSASAATIVSASAAEIEAIPLGPLEIPDRTLFKTVSDPSVWLMQNGERRHVNDLDKVPADYSSVLVLPDALSALILAISEGAEIGDPATAVATGQGTAQAAPMPEPAPKTDPMPAWLLASGEAAGQFDGSGIDGFDKGFDLFYRITGHPGAYVRSLILADCSDAPPAPGDGLSWQGPFPLDPADLAQATETSPLAPDGTVFGLAPQGDQYYRIEGGRIVPVARDALADALADSPGGLGIAISDALFRGFSQYAR